MAFTMDDVFILDAVQGSVGVVFDVFVFTGYGAEGIDRAEQLRILLMPRESNEILVSGWSLEYDGFFLDWPIFGDYVPRIAPELRAAFCCLEAPSPNGPETPSSNSKSPAPSQPPPPPLRSGAPTSIQAVYRLKPSPPPLAPAPPPPPLAPARETREPAVITVGVAEALQRRVVPLSLCTVTVSGQTQCYPFGSVLQSSRVPPTAEAWQSYRGVPFTIAVMSDKALVGLLHQAIRFQPPGAAVVTDVVTVAPGRTWLVTITPTKTANVTVDLAAGATVDSMFPDVRTLPSNKLYFSSDVTGPAVTIKTKDDRSQFLESPIVVLIDAGEPVSNGDANSLFTIEGNVTSVLAVLDSSGGILALTIEPASAGWLNVTVPAGAFVDLNGNGNPEAATAMVQYKPMSAAEVAAASAVGKAVAGVVSPCVSPTFCVCRTC